MKTSAEILKNTTEFLKSQGYEMKDTVDSEKIDKLLEILANSRNTQSSFYGWEPPHGNGALRKAKNFVQVKFKNIILNTLEKYVMRQQKYNEVIFQTISELAAENKQLREQLSQEK